MQVKTYPQSQRDSLKKSIQEKQVDVLINLKWNGHSDTEPLKQEMAKLGRLVLQHNDDRHMFDDLQKHYPLL